MNPGWLKNPIMSLPNRYNESLAKRFTNKFANNRASFMHSQGGDCCLYIITWEKNTLLVWNKIRGYSLVIGFLICLLSLAILKPVHWDAL